MKQNRRTCVLYVTATCNLNCRYCYIDKSPVLTKIDKILEDSYEGDYYFNFMQEMFDREILSSVEFWGGEPSYGLKRALPTVLKALNYFPNLNNFFFSTNLTTDTCIDDILNFYGAISDNYPERQISFGIQLSIDGPTHINDFNRGEKTTELFTRNFSKLVYELPNFLTKHRNITINAHFKPTMDSYAIEELQTKESIVEYYQFLEAYKLLSTSYLSSYSNQWTFDPAIPNTAVPSPHTKDEGLKFANYCRLINEILAENPEKKYFKWYQNIMPFSRPGAQERRVCLNEGCSTCGSGSSVVGLLPNDLISGCHNGFVELLSEYKNQVSNSADFYQIDTALFTNSYANHMVFTKEDFAVYERQVDQFCPKAQFQIVEVTALIRQMAAAGQIDNKYNDIKNAVDGAHFIQWVTSNCMRDNLGVTGSKYLFPLGFMRLFLNGAKEEIQKNADIHF